MTGSVCGAIRSQETAFVSLGRSGSCYGVEVEVLLLLYTYTGFIKHTLVGAEQEPAL